MIIYDSKKWYSLPLTIIKTFRESFGLQQLFWFMLATGAYATIITFAYIEYWNQSFVIDTVFFSLIGVILSLFLVFRLNSAYDRWWEGRKAWGKLVNDARTFAMILNTHIPEEDHRRRRFFVKSISNFCMALQWHLRDDVKYGIFIYISREYTEALEKSKHVPNKIASFIYDEIEVMSKEKVITDFDKTQLRTILQGFIDVLGICERIKKTPIPFSHSTFIKMFIVLYIAILPFGLVNVFQYLAIPGVLVMAFAMLGVEVISEEIENPFGLDANDLPTGQMSDGIRENVYEILHVRSVIRARLEAETEAAVFH